MNEDIKMRYVGVFDDGKRYWFENASDAIRFSDTLIFIREAGDDLNILPFDRNPEAAEAVFTDLVEMCRTRFFARFFWNQGTAICRVFQNFLEGELTCCACPSYLQLSRVFRNAHQEIIGTKVVFTIFYSSFREE